METAHKTRVDLYFRDSRPDVDNSRSYYLTFVANIGLVRLLRSSEGIRIHNAALTPAIVRSFLVQRECTKHRIEYLLDPTDKQDLFRALDLIELLYSYVETSLPPPKPLSTTRYRREHDPSASGQKRAKVSGIDPNIGVFCGVLTHFAWPFITITMSLSEQLEQLSAYSHLIYALFGQEKGVENGKTWRGVGFMPWGLYRDTQMTIQEIIHNVSKCQEVGNPEGYFFMTSMGPDA